MENALVFLMLSFGSNPPSFVGPYPDCPTARAQIVRLAEQMPGVTGGCLSVPPDSNLARQAPAGAVSIGNSVVTFANGGGIYESNNTDYGTLGTE